MASGLRSRRQGLMEPAIRAAHWPHYISAPRPPQPGTEGCGGGHIYARRRTIGDDHPVGFGRVYARDLALDHVVEHPRGVAFQSVSIAATTSHDMMEEIGLAHCHATRQQDGQRLDASIAAMDRVDRRATLSSPKQAMRWMAALVGPHVEICVLGQKPIGAHK